MKTTIDIPDELFTKAKSTAALRGESLRELITDALEAHLVSARVPASRRAGWRSVFGLATPMDVARVERHIASLEHIDPSEWR